MHKNSFIFFQVKANPCLSYCQLTKTFNKDCEKHTSSNTFRHILLRKDIGIYAAVTKSMMIFRELLLGSQD